MIINGVKNSIINNSTFSNNINIGLIKGSNYFYSEEQTIFLKYHNHLILQKSIFNNNSLTDSEYKQIDSRVSLISISTISV